MAKNYTLFFQPKEKKIPAQIQPKCQKKISNQISVQNLDPSPAQNKYSWVVYFGRLLTIIKTQFDILRTEQWIVIFIVFLIVTRICICFHIWLFLIFIKVKFN